MRTVFLFCIVTLHIASVSAITMDRALVSAYNNNEELKIIRTEFMSEIEQFPRALSSFMPRVSADFVSTNAKFSNRGFGAPNTDNVVHTKSITVSQPIFDGWSSVAELKSAQSSFRASRSSYYAKEQDIFLKLKRENPGLS